MSKEDHTPSLRFKGFTDAWEQCKFCNMVLIERGGSPRPIEDYITTDSEGINWIKIGDAPIYGNYITSTSEKIKLSGLSKTRQVFPGDLILSNSMSFGKPYIVTISGCIHDGWLLIRDENCNFIKEFLSYLLGTNYMLLQYKSLAAGSTVNNLNKDLVGSTNISYPNKKEQEKIADVLSQIDNLITLHQRKYDKLVEVKNSLFEKMFPADGESEPKIRFKGFTDAWEQRKLGDIVQITMGQSPDGSTYSAAETDYILVQGNADLREGWVYPRIWTTQKTKTADAGDLIMSVRAPAGSMGKTAYNVVIGRGVAAIKGNEFVYQNLIKKDINGFWKKLSAGSTFDSLNSNDIQEANIIVPSEDEQKIIGKLFEDIDKLITLHQRTLEKLNNIKKSLLERMFV